MGNWLELGKARLNSYCTAMKSTKGSFSYRWVVAWGGCLSALMLSGVAADVETEFIERVRPVLEEFCWDCHDPADSEGGVLFLDAETAAGIGAHRSNWRSAGTQLLNRTMPPSRKPQPSDEQRVEIAAWIDAYLRLTACDEGDYAGYVTARRLNRVEYNHTVRDLMGVDLRFSETLPADGGGGEGFDNNGQSLFLPPMLLERYLESAQAIVDAAIITPPINYRLDQKDFIATTTAGAMGKLGEGDEVSVLVPIYVGDSYRVELQLMGELRDESLVVRVDGIEATHLDLEANSSGIVAFDMRLARGVHAVSFQVEARNAIAIDHVRIHQRVSPPNSRRAATHVRLLGINVGEEPDSPRVWAKTVLQRLLPLAFRRPVEDEELTPYLTLVERSLRRGDPFEESMKLAFRGILVSPDFLFRIEKEAESVEPAALRSHELAVRLSYFLWSTMPDEELRLLADLGRLEDGAVLHQQVDRMLRDVRSWRFSQSFIGQWLGTKDVGGRVAPSHNEIQKFYTPEVAADMRAEAVWLWAHMLEEDRSVLEFIDADYTFLSERLAKFYGYSERYPELPAEGLRKVELKDDRRGGLLGLGAVLAMTSHFKEKSPVLRGAWVFDTMFGTPVPPPPADVPSLQSAKKMAGKGRTPREIIEQHREHPSCRACHNLIDPIGFALNNFDYLGRWEDTERGKRIDARGHLPTGESFDGPRELKAALLERKADFLRQLSRKLLGYALGRGLDDQDECTIVQLVESLERNDYRARSLVHAIVQSAPFRNRQLLDGK